MKKKLFFFGILVCCSNTFFFGQKQPYLNPNLSFDVTVKDIVSRLTLEEKVARMLNKYCRFFAMQRSKDPGVAKYQETTIIMK